MRLCAISLLSRRTRHVALRVIRAVEDVRTGDGGLAVDLVDLAHLGTALGDLDHGRLVQALDRLLDVVGHLVDDVVEADVDALLLGGGLGMVVGTDVETDDDRVGDRGEVDVGLAHCADAFADDLDLDRGVLDLGDLAAQGFE